MFFLSWAVGDDRSHRHILCLRSFYTWVLSVSLYALLLTHLDTCLEVRLYRAKSPFSHSHDGSSLNNILSILYSLLFRCVLQTVTPQRCFFQMRNFNSFCQTQMSEIIERCVFKEIAHSFIFSSHEKNSCDLIILNPLFNRTSPPFLFLRLVPCFCPHLLPPGLWGPSASNSALSVK